MGFFGKLFGGGNADSEREPAAAVPAVTEPQSAGVPAPAADLIARWDATVDDIHHRFDDILARATAASQPFMMNIAEGFTPLIQSWNAIEAQLHNHTEEVADGWDEISDLLSEVDGLADEALDHEGNKRDVAHAELEISYHRAYRGVMAQAGELQRIWALSCASQNNFCSHCGAALVGAKPVSQAVHVECPSCSAASIVDPGPELRMFAAAGAAALAEWEAFSAWEAMTRAETHINLYRDKKDVPMELLDSFDASSRDYWSTKLNAEARYVPELAPQVERKLEAYLKGPAKLLRQHWQWREQRG